MEISDLDNVLKLTTNRYIVTIAVAKRAEEIHDTASLLTRKLNPLSIAIKELAENKLKIRVPGFLED
ncbi:MAG: DNA-directed RNA polymerase subunit omega [bacterium]